MTAGKDGLFTWRAISWVLLALSLALNVFFIGGHIYTKRQVEAVQQQAAPRPARVRITPDVLGLNDRQTKTFVGFRKQVRKKALALRSESRKSAARVWAELESAKPDQSAIDRHLKVIFDNRYEAQREASVYAVQFLDGLDEAQKKKLVAMLKQTNFLGAGLLRQNAGSGRR